MKPQNLKQLRFILLVICLSLGWSLTAEASTATWSAGTTWSTATWNGGSDAYPGASGTTDVAVFNTAASLSAGLGVTIIPIANLTESLSTTGTVSISDASNALEFTGSPAITFAGSAPSQTLTLNLTSTFAGASAMQVTLIAGSVLNFGGNETTRKLYLPDAALTFNGAGTVNINNNVTVTGVPGASSTASAVVLSNGATMNFDGATFSGKFTSNALQVGPTCTLNLQSNPGIKTVMSGNSGSESLYITANGVTQTGVLQVAGAGNATANTATLGSNISAGGTSTIAGISTLDNAPGNSGTQTVVFSAAPNNTLNITAGLTGSSAGGLYVQVSGGGIVDFDQSAAANYVTSADASSTPAPNGTEIKTTGGDTILQLSNTNGLVSLPGNAQVDNGSTIQLLYSNQMSTSGTLTLNGAGGAAGTTGALENKSGTNTLGAIIALASASTISSDTNTLTLTGGINNGGVLLTISGTGNTTVSTAAITGAGGLTKSGSGTLTLAVGSSYGGTTTVNTGTLLLTNGSGSATGSGSISIANHATIGGAGSVNPTGSSTVTVASGGIIAAGGISGSSATPGFTVNAASNTVGASFLTVSGAVFDVNLGASNSAGTLSLLNSVAGEVLGLSGNTFNFTDLTSGSLTPGEYTLIQSDDSASNPFTGLTPGTLAGFTLNGLSAYTGAGDTVQLELNQNAGDSDDYAIQLDIIAVPEPSTWAMLVAGMGLLVCGQRARRRMVK